MAATILVLEDDPTFRGLLVDCLEDEGWQARGAGSGSQALKMAFGNRFDLLVTDVRMAGLDGLDTLAKLRELNSELKSIIITGYADSEAPTRAIRQMASDYLYKPFGVEELIRSVQDCLDAERRREQNLGLLSLFSKGYQALRRLLNESKLERLDRTRETAFQHLYVAIRSRKLDKPEALYVYRRLEALEARREGLKAGQSQDPTELEVGYSTVVDLLSALEGPTVPLQQQHGIAEDAFEPLYQAVLDGRVREKDLAMAPFLRGLDKLARAQSGELAELYQQVWG